jgi:hypothetical protein
VAITTSESATPTAAQEIAALLSQKDIETRTFINNSSKFETLEVFELTGDMWITLCSYYYSRGDLESLRLGIAEVLKARVLMISVATSQTKSLVIASTADTLWSLSTGFGSRQGLPSYSLVNPTITCTQTRTSTTQTTSTNLAMLIDYLKRNVSVLISQSLMVTEYRQLLEWVANEQVLQASSETPLDIPIEMDSRSLAGWTKVAYVLSICNSSSHLSSSSSSSSPVVAEPAIETMMTDDFEDDVSSVNDIAEDSLEFLSECLYNLSCCCWALEEKQVVLHSLRLYLENVCKFAARKRKDVGKVRDETILEILADSDFLGLQEEEGFRLLVSSF